MNILKKELVFWLVPSNGGQVKKLRFTVGRIVGAGAAVMLAGLCILFIAGDYVRIQWNGFKQSLHLESVAVERDSLLSSNEELQVKLEHLIESKDETDDFRKQVRQRLVELSRVLRSVPSPDLNSARDFKKTKAGTQEGMGGAEIPVRKVIGAARASPRIFEQGDVFSDEMLLHLDQLLTLLRITPLGKPVVGDVSSGFGFRWSPFEEGMLSKHEGVDFASKRGTPIVATADGIVTDVSMHGTYGLKVDITHHPELMSRYGHMSSALAKRGQIIRRGEVIGFVGSTGRSTGPHLHYEVRFRGKAINPEVYLGLHQRLMKTLG